jgi:hypothetical protein
MAAAIDPLRDRLLVWDGYTRAWSLAFSNPVAWDELALAGESPTPRLDFAMTYDPVGDQLVAYAGYDGSMKGDLDALHFSRSVSVELLPPRNRERERDTHHWVEAAILAARDFSPDSVQSNTVTLAGAHALDQDHRRHWNRPTSRTSPDDDDPPRWRDVNGDHLPDLVLRFPALALTPTDTIALLRGRTTHFEILGRALLAATHGRGSPESLLDPVAASAGLRLTPRSPTFSQFNMTCELPSTSPARLEVFDLAGRRLLVRAIEGGTPGAHQLELGDRTIPAGVYLLRLEQDSRAVLARAVLLR